MIASTTKTERQRSMPVIATHRLTLRFMRYIIPVISPKTEIVPIIISTSGWPICNSWMPVMIPIIPNNIGPIPAIIQSNILFIPKRPSMIRKATNKNRLRIKFNFSHVNGGGDITPPVVPDISSIPVSKTAIKVITAVMPRAGRNQYFKGFLTCSSLIFCIIAPFISDMIGTSLRDVSFWFTDRYSSRVVRQIRQLYRCSSTNSR